MKYCFILYILQENRRKSNNTNKNGCGKKAQIIKSQEAKKEVHAI